MPEIGLLSGSAEEKEYGYAPRSRVYAGPDWGWQTQESYDKIKKEQQSPLGMLKGGIRFISNTYQQATEAIYNTIPEPISGAIDAVVEPVTQALEQGYSKTPMGMAEEGAVQLGENIGNTFGNTTLGATTGFLLGTVIPGPGELKTALKASKGSIGMANISQEAKQILKRSQNVERIQSSILTRKAAGKSVDDQKAALSSAQSNVLPFTKENPKSYPPDTVSGKTIRTAEQARRNTTEMLELHHKVPKGMTAAYFDRMDYFISRGEADYNDLLEMAKEAEKLKLYPGDYKTNIQPMAIRPHNELHTAMRSQQNQGMFGPVELKKGELVEAMKQIKDPKTLKLLWKEWLSEDATYLRDTAEIWEKLDSLIKEIQSK